MDVLLRPSRDTLCHLPGVMSTVPWRGLVSNSAPLQDPREPLGCRLDKFLRTPRGNASPRPNLIIAMHRHTKAPPPVPTRNRTAIENLPSTPSTTMESSPKPKTRSAFPFFSSGKKSRSRKGHNEVPPDPPQAGCEPDAGPADSSSPDDVQPEPWPPIAHRQGATVVIAQDRLNNAGQRLKKKLPADLLGSGDFEIRASADVNSLADNIGATLVTFMDQRKIEQSVQSRARNLITEWAKKTIPFIETGLTIANVSKTRDQWQTDPDRTLFRLRII